MTELLLEALALKSLPRAGWLARAVPNPESVAAHSWGVAWLVLLLLPDELDRGLALRYAVLHDLAEVRVGDITPHDGVSRQEKARREMLAMTELCAHQPQLLEDWTRYERQADAESQFVRQLDRLDMALQATRYCEQHQLDATEFYDSADLVICHPVLKAQMTALRARNLGQVTTEG